jgi:hypothetical protein
MNTPTPSAPADKSILVESEVETENGKVVEQHIPRVRPHQLEIDRTNQIRDCAVNFKFD